MTTGPLVVVGDTLLDRDLVGSVHRMCPDAPVPVVDDLVEHARPGGAGLAALFAARDGPDVVLVTALADDDAGRRLRTLLADAGVRLVTTLLFGETPQKVRVRAGGQSLLRLDHGCGPAGVGPCTPAMTRAIGKAGAVLVADYGRGLAADRDVRRALAAHPEVIWDPHPRGPEPIPGVRLATPNLAEAGRFAPAAASAASLRLAATPGAEQGDRLREIWRADAVAVTLGADGAVLCRAGAAPLHVPAEPARGDTCGAGDRFASAAAGALLTGASLPGAVAAAVAAAAAYVGLDGPAGLRHPIQRSTVEVR